MQSDYCIERSVSTASQYWQERYITVPQSFPEFVFIDLFYIICVSFERGGALSWDARQMLHNLRHFSEKCIGVSVSVTEKYIQYLYSFVAVWQNQEINFMQAEEAL